MSQYLKARVIRVPDTNRADDDFPLWLPGGNFICLSSFPGCKDGDTVRQEIHNGVIRRWINDQEIAVIENEQQWREQIRERLTQAGNFAVDDFEMGDLNELPPGNWQTVPGNQQIVSGQLGREYEVKVQGQEISGSVELNTITLPELLRTPLELTVEPPDQDEFRKQMRALGMPPGIPWKPGTKIQYRGQVTNAHIIYPH